MTMKTPTFARIASSVAMTAMLTVAPSVFAQAGTATVHGHVTNPIGQNFSNGDVKFTKDRDEPFDKEKFLNVAPIDADGNYKATGVAPGTYFVIVVQGNKAIDKLDLTVYGGDDKTLDFDMTRAEYIKGMTPEERKALEEYKLKSAKVISDNAVIANLNATLKAVRADLATAMPTKGDVSKDIADMKSATTAKPDAAILWLTYGDTLQAQADHIKAEDKKAGKSAASDDELAQTFAQAIEAYKKADTLDKAAAKPNTAEDGVVLNQLGNAYGKSGKFDEAMATFDDAAKTDPTGAGRYYKNEAVILFNAGKNDEALTAADKSIAADPTVSVSYFIKGQALVAKSTFDPKTNKMTPPPGCIEAYQKFLELAPNAPEAAQVKEVLASLGEKIDKNYKAPKK
jgi:tetratricopeptide (TPR) repeat protein